MWSTLYSSGKHKLKPQLHTIIFLLEWLRLKPLRIPNAGKSMEQLMHLNSLDGTIKWYNHLENSLKISHMLEYVSSLYPWNFTPMHLAERNENLC